MNVAAIPASATRPVAPEQRVVVVGAGPAGMATAIELAQQGVPSVVLEKRGAAANREPLFAVAPPFADRLAALDPEGSLTDLLTPLRTMTSVDTASGRRTERPAEGELAPDAARSRGDMQALVDVLGQPRPTAEGGDNRPWSTVGIGTLENGLRELARTKHGDLIDLRADSAVEGVRQGDGWAEAVLAPGADGAARDAVRGAMLVDASGRDLLGGPRTVYPEQVNFVGARYAAPAPGSAGDGVLRRSRGGTKEAGDRHLTVALPAADRTLVWTQVPEAAGSVPPEEARRVVSERAPSVGVDEPLGADARTIPVTVQLWTGDEPSDGRVLKVGDSVRAPYFMTSSGAATALVHDAPAAVDAITSVLRGEQTADAASAGYADAVRGANALLIDLVRPRVLSDAGISPANAGPPERVTPSQARH